MLNMKLTSTSMWMRLLLATTLVLNILAIALPKPESLLLRRVPTAAGAVIRDHLFQRSPDKKFADGALDDASPPNEDENQDEATTPNEEEKEITPEDAETPEEAKSDDQQDEDLTSDKAATKGSTNPKSQVHPETHITAIEAAKGGKVEKSVQETFGTAKPAKPAKKNMNDVDFPVIKPCLYSSEHYELIFTGTATANLITGNVHDVSEALCPPGSISHAYSFTTTWSLSGQVGPDLKGLIPQSKSLAGNLNKLGSKFNVQYSWSNSQSTTYGASETSGQNHPFVLTYRPKILVVKGNIQKTTYIDAFKTRIECKVEHFNRVEMHIPVHSNDDCTSRKTACGPAVAWDHCFFVGAFAKNICPGRNLGPTPEKGRLCPASFYPPQYLHGRVGAIG